MAGKNTTEKGNDLRDRVYKLCVAAGKRNVVREYPISGKKADVYFEDAPGFEGVRRIAVECKHYRRPLGEREWTEISAGYSTRQASFDRLLVISENGFTSNFADGVAANKSWITALTWQEFLFNLIDFRNYFQSLSRLLHEKNLNSYYIRPQDTQGQDIGAVVDTWLSGKSNQPLAFLAGYGMGKSSLAKYLASSKAPEFQDGTFDRIPVYIKLGNLFDQQNLTSLITHYFSVEHQITNITPSLFKEMNRLGLLLVIFDGFDEMKHGMSHRDFKYIFSQIRELVDGDARVMVLGRPSALTSDSDRVVLFGTQEEPKNELLMNVQNEVKFKEIQIAEFDDQQLQSFVPSYIQSLNSELESNGQSKLDAFTVQSRISDVLADKFRALIRRPVHAQMMCRIAILSPKVKLTQTSIYKLYQSFVMLILEREVGKQARFAINEQQRLAFIIEAAWHFWPDKGLTGFTLEQLISANIAVPEKERPNDDIHREMLVGSLLEKKAGSLYYFSHRSFQEYLVAQYIINAETLFNAIDKVNRDVTSEIMVFIYESGHVNQVAQKVFSALGTLSKPINHTLLGLFDYVNKKELLEYIYAMGISGLSAKQSFIFTCLKYSNSKTIVDIKQFQNGECCAASLLALLHVSDCSDSESEAKWLLGLIVYFSKGIVQRADFAKNKLRNQIVLRGPEDNLWAQSLLNLNSHFDVNGELNALSVLSDMLFNSLNGQLKIVDFVMQNSGRLIQVSALDSLLKYFIEYMDGKGSERDRRHIDYRKILIQFFRAEPSEASFVFDKTKTMTTERHAATRKVLKLSQSL